MKKISSLMLAAVLSIATPVAAITIDTTSNASGSVQVGPSVDVNVTSETSVESNTSAEAESNSDAGVSVGTNGEIVIVNSDVLDNVTVTITSSGAVQSKSDLNAYAKGVVKTNADIRDVILSDTKVSVSHREHVRIFGIFPVKVFARASVANDGSVEVKFPWYAFAAQKKTALESKVKAAVKSSIPSVSAEASASAKLSSQAQAQVLEKTVATMKAELEADAAAKARVN